MEEIQVNQTENIATVIINRPEVKNAVTAPMWDELRDVFVRLGYDDTVRAVIVTGAGSDFCSGADVSAMGSGTGERIHQLESMRKVGDCCLALFNMPKITIARIPGVAVGAGMNMALACDIVIASDQARFSEIFAKRGLSVDFGGSFLLPRIVGLQKAKELVLLADVISAEEANRMGLVNYVVAPGDLDDKVNEVASKAVSGPPRAIAMSKAMLNRSFSNSLTEALDQEGTSQTFNFTTKDISEAMKAFQEKRSPEFKGW
ncbi:MAG TPA: enoyl-CoA hydratase [Acidimicrobiales bacterium]|jgi:2-(1,2-epoxy-1,2-dihydrophenyl)acetyl-CoA isomerase|nr:enoyl-CoA hydratase [Acidimicrobiales bacterium]|tara:strand:- start:1901 stop:2680 length:780 start_codon:yes stop_codon:yes gene_type:complete